MSMHSGSGAFDRRIFIKTVAIGGVALTAGLPTRALLAAGKAPDKINVAFFVETKPTMIAKCEGWFEKMAGGPINWSEVGSGAEINTSIAAKSVDIGLAIGSTLLARKQLEVSRQRDRANESAEIAKAQRAVAGGMARVLPGQPRGDRFRDRDAHRAPFAADLVEQSRRVHRDYLRTAVSRAPLAKRKFHTETVSHPV